jgi:hypothetical protein
VKRAPFESKIRSEWHEVDLPLPLLRLSPDTRAYQREAGDGHLSVFVGPEGDAGWHLSISHRKSTAEHPAGRYPRWDEIAEARERFVPDQVTMGMVLPPSGQYVAVHPTTFHLWQLPDGFGS